MSKVVNLSQLEAAARRLPDRSVRAHGVAVHWGSLDESLTHWLDLPGGSMLRVGRPEAEAAMAANQSPAAREVDLSRLCKRAGYAWR